MAIEMLTAEQIRAIPSDEPERLFSADPAIARDQYRRLALAWHPDRTADPRAGAVFEHVASLYRQAQARLATGTWIHANRLRLAARDGHVYEIRYRRRHPFELGDLFIGRHVLAYVLADQYADLRRAALDTIEGFSFATAAMRAEVTRYLPKPLAAFRTRDAAVLVLRKPATLVLLRDLLDYLGGTLPAEHAAWILSTLLNLACYLRHAGLTHNAIALDTYFVAPAEHSGALLGGWWYAAPRGAPLRALPARSLSLLPPDLLAAKRADPRLDLDLIRDLGRAMLGEERGAASRPAVTVPAPLRRWLRLASGGDAVADYEEWQRNVLPESFGPRRFVRLPVSPDDIYS